jgi:molybdopterin-guanine dinucleotide biosynthesis protein A
MLGIPKGLLRPPNGADAIVQRLVRELALAGLHDLVLVGENEAYADLRLPMVADSPSGHGPMAGLLALTELALRRGQEFVLALACDMPAISARLIQRLCAEDPLADALVPRHLHWEPLCARYRAHVVRPLLGPLLRVGRLRMTDLLDALGERCVAMSLEPSELDGMRDWDCPSDLPEGVVYQGVLVPTGRRML